MILYTEDPKDATKKLLEFINEFGKIARYKINSQKFLVILYTNNKRSERENKEIVQFATATKIIKYLEINLSKGDKRTVHKKL